MCGIAITNMTSSIEEENGSDYFDDENSGSETEDHESQTSDDDDEIDLENLKLNDNSTWQKFIYFQIWYELVCQSELFNENELFK